MNPDVTPSSPSRSSPSSSPSSPPSSSLPSPPAWAEAVLRACLKPRDGETVSGDLLEAYRDSIHPTRGQTSADVWYIRQVTGIVVRTTGVWAALFAAAFVARTAWDWWVPTTDFSTRSTMSTALAAMILLLAGFTASTRSGSRRAGAIAGVATTTIAAVVSVAGVAVLFAFVHDDDTRLAINGSGGLDEAYTLPVTLILPGLILGTLGGVVGAAVHRMRSVS